MPRILVFMTLVRPYYRRHERHCEDNESEQQNNLGIEDYSPRHLNLPLTILDLNLFQMRDVDPNQRKRVNVEPGNDVLGRIQKPWMAEKLRWGYEDVKPDTAEASKLFGQSAELSFTDAPIRIGQARRRHT
jgi:hypothetical protein